MNEPQNVEFLTDIMVGMHKLKQIKIHEYSIMKINAIKTISIFLLSQTTR
jgi:hypothetical protein